MSLSRRRLLQVSGGMIAASSIAGCSYFDENTRYTSLNIGNRTEEQQTIRVTVLDDESDTRSGLFSEEVELASNDEDSNTEVFQDAFEAQRALVEVRMVRSNMQQQFTYQPSPACEEDERGDVLSIRFDNPYSANWEVACESE